MAWHPEFLNSLRLCCPSCNELWKEHHEQTDFYKPVDVHKIYCRSGTEFKKLKDELFLEYPSKIIGTMSNRSETRSRPSLESRYETEMDWALIAINYWDAPFDSHIREVSKDLHFGNILAGARVRAIGRTTNTARSIVRHQNPTRLLKKIL